MVKESIHKIILQIIWDKIKDKEEKIDSKKEPIKTSLKGKSKKTALTADEWAVF